MVTWLASFVALLRRRGVGFAVLALTLRGAGRPRRALPAVGAAGIPAWQGEWTGLRSSIAVLVCLLFAGCASLPSLDGRVPSTVLPPAGLSRLAASVAPEAQAHPGQSAVYAMPGGTDAFISRALLAAAADRSLDVQYYIWRDDITGMLLLEQLWRAAERGVRVRLLLDDNGARMDDVLVALEAHPNIEVRLFNPFVQRSLRPLGYVTDFARVNRRMHNKSLTADGQVTIVGGRNIGDEYFGAGEGTMFADLDVLVAGPAAAEVGSMFDEYWNSNSAYPVNLLLGSAAPDAAAALATRFAQTRASAEAQRYVRELERAPLAEFLRMRNLPVQWSRVDLVFDAPAKGLGRAKAAELLAARLAETLGTATKEVDIVSPYFVPGDMGTVSLTTLAASGVRVRVVTNSLAASDVAAVHSGYARRREPLLRSGVALYEIKPYITQTHSPAAGVGSAGSSSASLHAKTFAIDGARVFVGSFNFDPRSFSLNTEMGVVIHSPSLARSIHSGLDAAVSRAAYRVELAPKGGLQWTEHGDGGEVRYTAEPRTGWLKRTGVRLLEWLPIESLL